MTPLKVWYLLREYLDKYTTLYLKDETHIVSVEGYSLDIIENVLKALEIIKETPIFVWYITIYENAYEMVADVKGFRINESVEELQEKFDLLKEVLL